MRRKTAAVQLDQLVAVALRLWNKVVAEKGPTRRGRPAHCLRLRELLDQQGIEITDWRLRKLMAELRKGDKGDGV